MEENGIQRENKLGAALAAVLYVLTLGFSIWLFIKEQALSDIFSLEAFFTGRFHWYFVFRGVFSLAALLLAVFWCVPGGTKKYAALHKALLGTAMAFLLLLGLNLFAGMTRIQFFAADQLMFEDPFYFIDILVHWMSDLMGNSYEMTTAVILFVTLLVIFLVRPWRQVKWLAVAALVSAFVMEISGPLKRLILPEPEVSFGFQNPEIAVFALVILAVSASMAKSEKETESDPLRAAGSGGQTGSAWSRPGGGNDNPAAGYSQPSGSPYGTDYNQPGQNASYGGSAWSRPGGRNDNPAAGYGQPSGSPYGADYNQPGQNASYGENAWSRPPGNNYSRPGGYGSSAATWGQAPRYGQFASPYRPPASLNKPSIGLNILSFFFPLVGMIIFLVMGKSEPRKADSAGLWALIGFIVHSITGMLLYLGLMMVMSEVQMYL